MQSKKLTAECNSEMGLPMKPKGNTSWAKKTKAEVLSTNVKVSPEPNRIPPQLCALTHCDIISRLSCFPLVYSTIAQRKTHWGILYFPTCQWHNAGKGVSSHLIKTNYNNFKMQLRISHWEFLYLIFKWGAPAFTLITTAERLQKENPESTCFFYHLHTTCQIKNRKHYQHNTSKHTVLPFLLSLKQHLDLEAGLCMLPSIFKFRFGPELKEVQYSCTQLT